MKLILRAVMPGTLCVVAGCSGVQAALDPAGDQARAIHGLWTLMLWVCGGMYLLVLSFLAAAVWRARRSGAAGIGADSTNELRLRRGLAGWSALIIVGLITLTLATFLLDRNLARASTQEALTIKITAAQWWWKVEYEDALPARHITTANELYLPVDRPVRLELQAEDVIHSLWLPNLAGKKDLIPGRTTTLLFTPTRTGRYRGQCAEFCGLQHAHMALDATVLGADEFEQWRQHQSLEGAAPLTEQQRHGQQLFTTGACAACHQIIGTEAAGQSGPNLTHLASRHSLAAGALPRSADALRSWLVDPQGVKPGNHMPRVPLAPDELEALVAYLENLK